MKKSLSYDDVKLSMRNTTITIIPKPCVTINDLEQYQRISEEQNECSSTITSISPINIEKKVKFCKNVKVILIPTLNEYIEAQLKSVIWWNDEDYKSFKSEAVIEIKQYIEKYPDISVKEAISLLYNGGEIDVLWC